MKLRLNEFSLFKIANPGSWSDKGEGMGLSCRVKPVKEGGFHSNPPGTSCWGMWEQSLGPPGCCRMGWGQGCIGATELLVAPRGSLTVPPSPADSLSRAGTFLLQSPWHPGVNSCQKGEREAGAKSKQLRNDSPQSFLPRQSTESKNVTFPNN